jgi:hypothetical protein
MRRLFDLSRYHAVLLFLMLAVCAIGFAWNTFGLITLAMANASFLVEHRVMAIVEGGLVQTAVLAARGLAALVFYLGFKGIEAELVARWRGGRS